MNKNEAIEKREKLLKEISELTAIIEKPELKLWKPEVGEIFDYVLSDCFVQTRSFDNSPFETVHIGNCFKKGLGHKAKVMILLAYKLANAALQADPDAGPADDKRRYAARKDANDKWLVATFCDNGPLFAVHTLEQAKFMADILNAEGV